MKENSNNDLVLKDVANADTSDELELAEEDYDANKFHRILDYIGTKKGDVMLGRVVSMFEQVTPAAKTYFEALAEIKRGNPAIEYKKWRALLVVRLFVVALALGSMIYLKLTDNLDSTTSLIIVTALTIFFTFGRKQQ